MFSRRSQVALFPLTALMICCDKHEEPKPAAAQHPASPAETTPPDKGSSSAPSPEKAKKVTENSKKEARLLWEVPPGWKEMPERPMRQATYQVEGKDGPAQMAIFYFGPGDGGGVEANISRWVGQFQDLPEGGAERSEDELAGLRRTHVRIDRGTYLSGMPGRPATPQKNWALQASIVESPQGHYFFKMTGPADTVAQHREEFAQMLSSVRLDQD